MLKIIMGLFEEIWFLLLEMSPYLLFGFLIAGVLYVVIPKGKIYSHFSKNNFFSIVKASLFGIPLPLCSCGVIPVAAHLRKEGAAKGPTLSFLISTPTSGVDSVLATYSLLGILFAIIRPMASFFAATLAGIFSNIVERKEEIKYPASFSCNICDIDSSHSHSIIDRIKVIFRYAFYDLISDVGKWIIIGVVVGGLIGFFVPTKIVEQYLGNPLLSYPFMLLIGIPMYICATGSIPIAASLIIKGMSPGAGLLFLIAGPATNAATISFVGGKLGKKTLFIYLSTIVFTAILFGGVLDYAYSAIGKSLVFFKGSIRILPYLIKVLSSVVIIVFIIIAMLKKSKKTTTNMKKVGMVFEVPDMTCEHCVKTIDMELRKIQGIKDVNIDLKAKKVKVIGDISKDLIIFSIKKAGYSVKE